MDVLLLIWFPRFSFSFFPLAGFRGTFIYLAETGDVFSCESAERLMDLSLAVVYIPMPRLRMRRAHAFRRRGLQQTSFSYFLEIWTQVALWLY